MKEILTKSTNTFDGFYRNEDDTLQLCKEEVLKMLGIEVPQLLPESIIVYTNKRGKHVLSVRPEMTCFYNLNGKRVTVHCDLQRYLDKHFPNPSDWPIRFSIKVVKQQQPTEPTTQKKLEAQ